jgi:hypothetical protein
MAALLFWACALCAESSYPQSYLKSYPQSVVEAANQVPDWQIKEWLTAGGIILSIGALYLADEEIRDLMQDNRTETSAAIMTFGKQFGEGKYVLPAIGTCILGGYIAGSEKTMDTGLLSLKSFILSQSVTQSLKLATQRRRPSANAGKEFWSAGGFKRKHDSFPSGHSTMAWSLAPILAEQYQEQKWVAPAVYGIATLTSISRVHDNNHWASDVFTGAVIGYFSAKLVLSSTPRLEWAVHKDGLGLTYRF